MRLVGQLSNHQIDHADKPNAWYVIAVSSTTTGLKGLPNRSFPPPALRRSQSSRREAARTALLDATIELLAEEGLAATTTRRVAQRAGVTPGALMHHFPSKVLLLEDAWRRIQSRVLQAMVDQRPPDCCSMRQRHEFLLDRMWELYNGPLFSAAVELWAAGRTNPDLRERCADTPEQTRAMIELGVPVLYPELVGSPDLVPLIITGQATMRGLILMATAGQVDPEQAWPQAREHLLTMSAAVLGLPEMLA
jgi:AcrR family transcriptional regulator